jgi:hypothetical protein
MVLIGRSLRGGGRAGRFGRKYDSDVRHHEALAGARSRADIPSIRNGGTVANGAWSTVYDTDDMLLEKKIPDTGDIRHLDAVLSSHTKGLGPRLYPRSPSLGSARPP